MLYAFFTCKQYHKTARANSTGLVRCYGVNASCNVSFVMYERLLPHGVVGGSPPLVCGSLPEPVFRQAAPGPALVTLTPEAPSHPENAECAGGSNDLLATPA